MAQNQKPKTTTKKTRCGRKVVVWSKEGVLLALPARVSLCKCATLCQSVPNSILYANPCYVVPTCANQHLSVPTDANIATWWQSMPICANPYLSEPHCANWYNICNFCQPVQPCKLMPVPANQHQPCQAASQHTSLCQSTSPSAKLHQPVPIHASLTNWFQYVTTDASP